MDSIIILSPFKKTAAESHRMLLEAYGYNALSETTRRDWFRRFKAGDYDVEDKELPGHRKCFKTKNCKHYWMKMTQKCSENSQNK